MFDEENPESESLHEKFEKAFFEENLVYKDPKKDKYFKLHVESAKDIKEPKEHKDSKDHKPKKSEDHFYEEKRSLKEILKDASRQIIASAIILIIGFLVFNWSAYYKIAMSKWDKYRGVETVSMLTELTETTKIVHTEKLETSSDPEVLKKQIPDLNIDISPVDNRLIIPRIDQNIPVVRVSSENLIKRDWDALENEMQEALQDGVVHYPGTSLPGQAGNSVITGHSSYFPWDSGRFKDVFALLHDVVVGDKIVVYYEQDKIIYEVYDIQVVLPDDIEVLKQSPNDKLTLITCTPVGTNLKRLIVHARPIAINDIPIPEEKLTR